MPVLRPYYADPFSPVLLNSESLNLSLEQRNYIREILETACSDSRFAEKAYIAIIYVLTHGKDVVPVVSSINPSSATIGDPSFTLHVTGTGFDSSSQIVWNGSVEPTTFVSATELTTLVNMVTAQFATDIPVAVQSGSGVVSNVMTFTLNDVASNPTTTPAPTPTAYKSTTVTHTTVKK